MALKPAAGARDLNPQQVESNHLLSQRLAKIYRLWGYEEVAPPRIERTETLMAGGGISSKEIATLVANEPLGLRPEMTASIARAACTRLAKKPRPLRLWSSGTVFESNQAIEGGLLIEENLKSGVELFGIKGITAEIELLCLLIDAYKECELNQNYKPSLLIGHTSIMDLILEEIPLDLREMTRSSLVNLNRIDLDNLSLENELKEKLIRVLSARGSWEEILNFLESTYGKSQIFDELYKLFNIVDSRSKEEGIKLFLDTTFQPHFNLYNGLVFQLVCEGVSAPIVIAKGGRYDKLVEKFGTDKSIAAGTGFSFAIDKVRELSNKKINSKENSECVLIAYSKNKKLEDALVLQHDFHKKSIKAVIEHSPCETKDVANNLLIKRECSRVEWIE